METRKRPRKADGFYQQFANYGRQANCKEDIQFIELRSQKQSTSHAEVDDSEHLIIYDDDVIIDDNDNAEDNADNDSALIFKDTDVHMVERAVDKRTVSGGITEYLLLWKGCPKEDASWVQSCYVTESIKRYYHAPTPYSDVIQDSVGTFTVELDKSLRKGSCRDFTVNVNFRHDVFRFLFKDKTTLYYNDFDRKYFKEGWDQCFSNYRDDDDYNTGHKLAYPVKCRLYFRSNKDGHFRNCNSDIVNKLPSFIEMVAFKIKKINCC